MADLKESLEVYLDKALKVVKSADKFINGAEKQLVLEIGSYTTKVKRRKNKNKRVCYFSCVKRYYNKRNECS